MICVDLPTCLSLICHNTRTRNKKEWCGGAAVLKGNEVDESDLDISGTLSLSVSLMSHSYNCHIYRVGKNSM